VQKSVSPAKPRKARSRAEGVRFELTRPFGLPVFKTGAINRSATPPDQARIRGRKFITALLHYAK
jgi:hypothetical protein